MSVEEIQDGVLDLSTLEPEFSADPYSVYAEERAKAPIRRVRLHGLPAWLVTRYEDVERFLTDPRLSNDRKYTNPAIREAAPWEFADDVMGLSRHMLQADPPDHTRLRRVVGSVFTARRIEELGGRIQEITDGLIAGFLPRGEVELVKELATPLPIIVIMELLGVPMTDRDDFQQWTDIVMSGPEDPQDAIDAFLNIHRYLTRLVATKTEQIARGEQQPDLLSALVAVRDSETGRLDAEELVATARLLLIAGYETTASLIGNGVFALLRQPDQLALLLEEPELIEAAVEELLRFEAPVDTPPPRYATEDFEFGGVTVRAGDGVLLGLGASGRDPARFAEPDRIDLRRTDRRHLAFGHGWHYCLGAPLARLEGRIALGSLLKAAPDLALAVPADQVPWRPDPYIRGLKRLPLRFTPPA